MSSGISAAEPTFRWDILIESSPEGAADSIVFLALRAEPVYILRPKRSDLRLRCITSDPGRKGASGDVLIIVFDQDAVVSRQDRQVGHRARPILVVHTADVSLGRTLDGQGQTTCRELESALIPGLFQIRHFLERLCTLQSSGDTYPLQHL